MRWPWVPLSAIALTACTAKTPVTDEARDSPAAAASPAAPKPVRPTPPPPGSCEAATQRYLDARAALNRCERDAECAEIWPGVCPHGPYYIHRDADLVPVRAAAGALESRCELPECEKPMSLGMARCVDGICVPGREAPRSTAVESCWDYRETYLEARDTKTALSVVAVQGITPHLVIAPAGSGTLRLTVDWPRTCSDCTLLVSEHQSGMANLVDTTPKSSEDAQLGGVPIRREQIELAVTAGPYHIIAKSSAPAQYRLQTDLEHIAVTRHGTSWVRLCEG